MYHRSYHRHNDVRTSLPATSPSSLSLQVVVSGSNDGTESIAHGITDVITEPYIIESWFAIGARVPGRITLVISVTTVLRRVFGHQLEVRDEVHHKFYTRLSFMSVSSREMLPGGLLRSGQSWWWHQAVGFCQRRRRVRDGFIKGHRR